MVIYSPHSIAKYKAALNIIIATQYAADIPPIIAKTKIVMQIKSIFLLLIVRLLVPRSPLQYQIVRFLIPRSTLQYQIVLGSFLCFVYCV